MENLKKSILEKYPSVTFKNEIFFRDNRVLEDFSIEDIAFKLCQLNDDDAWNLNMWLYVYDAGFLRKSLLKFLVKNDINYFENFDNNKKESEVSLLEEFERIYKNFDFSIADLNSAMIENDKINKDKYPYDFDIIHVKLIVMTQKLFKEKKINLDEIKIFVDSLFKLLKDKVIKQYGNYDVVYDDYIKEAISYLLDGKISVANYYEAISNDNTLSILLSKAKLGDVSYSIYNNIPLDILMSLKTNRIQMWTDILLSKKVDLDREQIIRFLVNFCSLLGEVNVDTIIKNLPEDVDKIRRLLFAFNEINISGVVVENRKIIYKTDFIKFFMGSRLDDPGSLLNLIYEGETSLRAHIENLYYSFEQLFERYKSQKQYGRKQFFENFFNKSKIAFNPDEYLLEGHIINSYFENRHLQNLKSVDFVKGVREVYRSMKHNYQKSIPYVSGSYGEYTYETLKANDPELLSVGSDTDCCFKIGGQADSFVRYCANDKNGRVLAIKNKNGRLVAMVPMVRNGNLILCNTVESNNKKSLAFMTKMFEILEIFSERMFAISEKNESENTRIRSVLCGNHVNDINQFGKYEEIDSYYYGKLAPLNPYVSCNMAIDSNGFYCIKSDEYFSMNDFYSFSPDVVYDDPRDEPLELEIDCLDDDRLSVIQCRIDAIAFESNYQKVDLKKATMVIFNEDWFIVVDKFGNIHSSIVGDDTRALEEYNEYLELEKTYYGNFKRN